ncbi:aminoacyl-tRNA hydrolase [Mangrovactinospora gilvigrisea]|uniref:Peptidyl-tRNA hydrolase n=1 Tax=Mangrovactinospora gilvigrisea TaxID=1428644 RepID=A0A1J7CBH8_9ACTN|nr:aminoacyl-tRNA hydrolase [Mangrovactinospora gilvigrisea]OIV38872.1 aminoacyl-tRNA hydrolase [Mangrovactinospora gilvigrisea]
MSASTSSRAGDAQGPADTAGPWLVAGLGNPGPEYAGNRHNIGFMVADLLAERLGASFKAHRARARVAEGRLGIGGPRLVLAEPMSYMNTSGGPVTALLDFYKIPSSRLIAIHDELDIDYGTLRLKRGGGDNGHNGLKSLTKALGPEYFRVRCGIGRPPGRMEVASFVLRDFSSTEKKDLEWFVDRAADATEALITQGLERAQSAFNS